MVKNAKSKNPKSKNPEVDEWFAEYEHPAHAAMERVRTIVLEEQRMEEVIKWRSPTFMYKGNMASFNPRTKSHVSLMFHTGAAIPGAHPRLQGRGDTARYMTFADLAEVDAAADELRAIVASWCAAKE